MLTLTELIRVQQLKELLGDREITRPLDLCDVGNPPHLNYESSPAPSQGKDSIRVAFEPITDPDTGETRYISIKPSDDYKNQ